MTSDSTTRKMQKGGKGTNDDDCGRQRAYVLLLTWVRRSSTQNLLLIRQQPDLSDPERVIYAALSPIPQTFTAPKSACRSWEDHLWAQISILCEEKQRLEMLKLKGATGGAGWPHSTKHRICLREREAISPRQRARSSLRHTCPSRKP